MIINNNIIRPDKNKKLIFKNYTSLNDFYAFEEIILSKYDSVDNYIELTIDEYNNILSSLEKENKSEELNNFDLTSDLE